ncbi:MAG: flap endonuclease [Candidatus Latescibacteria bacterium]|nr:flap endonuclease [Candidatus Latescibacterota bacterium]
MNVHLVDGTYELFRHYYAVPSRLDAKGEEVGGLVGVVISIVSMLREGATHVGVATDHVVESFRNEMYAGYKTGEGIEPALWRQFHPLEDALRALGVTVWAMVDQEADDALAAAAHRAAEDARVERVFICTPDKDLAQCVRGDCVVQLDRRRAIVRDEASVREKFSVGPESIPDFLGLVGDSADGFPGVPQWGEKSAGTVLARYDHLEGIPKDATTWDVPVRGAAKLAESLREHWEEALLFRDLATLRTDAEVFQNVDDLRWRGPTPEFAPLCEHLGVPELAEQVRHLLPRK